jgi:hypothetical protein
MSTTTCEEWEALRAARARGARLSAHDGRIRYRGPREVFTEIEEMLKAHKGQILAVLSGEQTPKTIHWMFKGEKECRTATYVIPTRRKWLDGLTMLERAALASAIRKARRGDYVTDVIVTGDTSLVDVNLAIIASVRMRCLPHLRGLVQHVERMDGA